MLSTMLLFAGASQAQQARHNIVLILMDNLVYGELGVYGGGILRGAPTPRCADDGTVCVPHGQ